MSAFTFLIEESHPSLNPVDVFRILKSDSYPFFLDSGMDPHKLGRFSFLSSNPFLILKSKNGKTCIAKEGREESFKGNPFEVLKELLAKYSVPKTTEAPFPFTGGAVGYFGYDLRHHIEKLSRKAIDDIGLDDLSLGFYDTAVVIDHLLGKTYIVSTGFPELDEAKREKRARKRLLDLKARLASRVLTEPSEAASCAETKLESNFKKDDYLKAIEKAKDYIAKGDIYQVNLSQRFSSSLNCDPFDLYLRLRSINPAPFAAYLDFGEAKIISASPERFLSLRNGVIHTRPIKGTRPRGADASEDSVLAHELLESAKDKAEHLMIVDLERNDLGRVCEFGSVRPTEFITLEKYSTVFHLVSTVSGVVKSGMDAVDCLTNCFPGGSITGAPKIRSMEIIDELEPTSRSVYTGSIGYISFTGDMDTSIVIRTILVKNNQLYFQVGGGIVTDSDPEAEYQETLDKAKALITALSFREQLAH